jgi:excisionase family DNA binding protein
MAPSSRVKLPTDEIMRRDGFIRARLAAEAVGVHLTTIYRWVYDGKLASSKVGNSRFISVTDLLEMFASSPSIQQRVRRAAKPGGSID